MFIIGDKAYLDVHKILFCLMTVSFLPMRSNYIITVEGSKIIIREGIAQEFSNLLIVECQILNEIIHKWNRSQIQVDSYLSPR